MYYFDFKTSKGLSVVCFVFELGDAGGELRDTHLQKVVAVFAVAEAIASGHKRVVLFLVYS